MPDLFGFGSTVNNIGETARQSMSDQTKNNTTDADTTANYNKTLIDQFNSLLAGYKTKNDIAVKNPASFAKQAALSDFLSRDRGVNGGAGGGPKGLGDSAKAALSTLQQQAINNLLASPKDNPVPAASSVQDPSLVNPSIYSGNAVGKLVPRGVGRLPSADAVPVGTAVPRV